MPTSTVRGMDAGEISTSTSTGFASMPSNEYENNFASMNRLHDRTHLSEAFVIPSSLSPVSFAATVGMFGSLPQIGEVHYTMPASEFRRGRISANVARMPKGVEPCCG